ncbi:MAG: cation-translocating P-type ATPase, partial [Candidatus Izemoplasmataceae bacterium]
MEALKDAYKKSKDELINTLKTDIKQGLSQDEAEKRLTEYGPNRLQKQKKLSIIKIIIKQFKSLVMILLTLAAIASYLLGDDIEAIAVFVVIIITVIIGFLMEYKAGESIEALQKSIKEESKVLRNKEIITMLTEEIVIGDIVYLVEGNKVPADGRIIEVNELSVDESMLTGESKAVNKTDQVIKNKEKLTDQLNMVFMGTSILKGSAKMLVTATAEDTEMGKISDLLKQAKPKRTPLERRLEQTGRFLILLTLIISFIVLLMGLISGNTIETMVKTTVALAIAAVPEGLPAAATITLAIGMKRMAEKNALLRNLPAVETLGSTTVLCTDKTGTLTENKMTLRKIVTYHKTFKIKGSGYDSEGVFKLKDKTINPLSNKLLSKIFKVFLFCNESKLQQDDAEYSVIGDPTEGALLIALKKAKLDEEKIENDYEQIEILPFDPDKKYMAAHYISKDNKSFIALKGAPNVILSMCDYYEDKAVKKLTKKAKDKVIKQNDALSKDSYRVLALAYKEIDSKKTHKLDELTNKDLIYLGLTALQDPARSGIEKSIQKTKHAGIKTIMLTGDQQKTAVGIAKDLGIDVNQDELSEDKAIKDYSKKELFNYLKDNHIFSRVTPEDKLLIIEALQDNNEIVAMTGDGVNDAPALKKADIGIAMGKRGSSVAKESADMILLDDRYQTIIEAIKQGRVIFDNIQK